MVEYQGVGLAGPQAGVNLQIFVASPNGTKEDATKCILIHRSNPESELQVLEEGCLSLPKIYGKIMNRYYRCTVKALILTANLLPKPAKV
jgi:peptide deformylase